MKQWIRPLIMIPLSIVGIAWITIYYNAPANIKFCLVAFGMFGILQDAQVLINEFWGNNELTEYHN